MCECRRRQDAGSANLPTPGRWRASLLKLSDTLNSSVRPELVEGCTGKANDARGSLGATSDSGERCEEDGEHVESECKAVPPPLSRLARMDLRIKTQKAASPVLIFM